MKRLYPRIWLAAAIGLIVLPLAAEAETYIPQSALNVPFVPAALDRDAVGNIYLLGLPTGSANFELEEEATSQTQNLSPISSFNTGLSTFSAFAVEDSGIIDILDDSNGWRLTRFSNSGTFISSAAYFVAYITPNLISTAIDKINQRVYIAYQYTYTPIYVQCLGCQGPSSVTTADINQYDFEGNLLASFPMPGSSSSACNTPSAIAVDAQGNVHVEDSVCQQIFDYSPSGALLSHTPNPEWISARAMWSDSNSDLYISGTVCSGVCAPNVVRLGSGGSLQTNLIANSNAGLAWDGRILYLSNSAQPLERWVYDDPPSVPAEISPIGLTVQHSSAATLSWQAANDPDGDSILYTVYFGMSPSQMSAVQTTNQTQWTTPPLNFGTNYYWQIIAQDFYLGLPLGKTPSPLESFNLSLVNNPPNPFSVISGTGTFDTRASSQTLSWTQAQDPDGDPVSYELFFSSSPDFNSPITTTMATAWTATNLDFGTTYYWQVLAEDSYGATTAISGGTQSYLPIFWNPQPSPVVYLSTASSYNLHTSSPVISLAWSPSQDAALDPIDYSLYVRTSTDSWPVIPMDSSTGINLNTQIGTTYYWEVLAENPYGGISTGTWQNFIVNLQNNPPGSFSVLSGTGTFDTRASSQTLSWTQAQDPDGDAVSYDLSLSTVPGNFETVNLGSSTAYLLNFQYGTTYYWSVSAIDSFGAATEGTLERFLPLFDNPPIPAPLIYGDTGTLSEHTPSPSARLSWSAVSDKYGDAISYRVYLGTSTQGLSLIQNSSATSLNLTNPQFDTTYYWQVEAYDNYGASSATAVQSLLILLQNNPPGSFSVISGTGTFDTRASSQTLSWTQAQDPDGDAVSYDLYLSTVPGNFETVNLGSSTAYVLNFQYGTTYYWSVSAFDELGASSTINGSLETFLPIFLNEPPPPPNLVSPFVQSPVVTSMSNNVTISWEKVSDPQNDPIAYTLYFGESPADMTPLAVINQSPQSPNAASLSDTPLALDALVSSPRAWALPPIDSALSPKVQLSVSQDSSSVAVNIANLDYYQNYYLRVVAANPYGSQSSTQLQNFSLAANSSFPKAYNWPNPFSPFRGGTHIVFNAPPSGYSKATVEIYSEWQTLLFKRDYFNIPPGISQQSFDGRDRYGKPFFNGSYICKVRFSGPNDGATFYIMVVK